MLVHVTAPKDTSEIRDGPLLGTPYRGSSRSWIAFKYGKSRRYQETRGIGAWKTAWTELWRGKWLSANLAFWGRVGWTCYKQQQHLHTLCLHCHFIFWAPFWAKRFGNNFFMTNLPAQNKQHSQRNTSPGVCLLCTSGWDMAQGGTPFWGTTGDIPNPFMLRQGQEGPGPSFGLICSVWTIPVLWPHICCVFRLNRAPGTQQDACFICKFWVRFPPLQGWLKWAKPSFQLYSLAMRQGYGSPDQVPVTPRRQPDFHLVSESWWAPWRWLEASGCITVLLWKTQCGYCKLLLAEKCKDWLCFFSDLAGWRPRLSSWLTCCIQLGGLGAITCPLPALATELICLAASGKGPSLPNPKDELKLSSFEIVNRLLPYHTSFQNIF